MSNESISSGDADGANLPNNSPDHTLHRHPGELLTVWVLWLVYGAFYFCRTNLSSVIPGITKSLADGGLALSGQQVGLIQGSYKFSYSIGQLIKFYWIRLPQKKGFGAAQRRPEHGV